MRLYIEHANKKWGFPRTAETLAKSLDAKTKKMLAADKPPTLNELLDLAAHPPTTANGNFAAYVFIVTINDVVNVYTGSSIDKTTGFLSRKSAYEHLKYEVMPKFLKTLIDQGDSFATYGPVSLAQWKTIKLNPLHMLESGIHTLIMETILMIWMRTLPKYGNYEYLMAYSPWKPVDLQFVRSNSRPSLTKFPSKTESVLLIWLQEQDKRGNDPLEHIVSLVQPSEETLQRMQEAQAAKKKANREAQVAATAAEKEFLDPDRDRYEWTATKEAQLMDLRNKGLEYVQIKETMGFTGLLSTLMSRYSNVSTGRSIKTHVLPPQQSARPKVMQERTSEEEDIVWNKNSGGRYVWNESLDEKITALYRKGKSWANIKKELKFPGAITTIRERLDRLGEIKDVDYDEIDGAPDQIRWTKSAGNYQWVYTDKINKRLMELQKQGMSAADIKEELEFPSSSVTLQHHLDKLAKDKTSTPSEEREDETYRVTWSKRSSTHYEWTDAIDGKLLKLHQSGMNHTDIKRKMGFPGSSLSITWRLNKLLGAKKTQKRKADSHQGPPNATTESDQVDSKDRKRIRNIVIDSDDE